MSVHLHREIEHLKRQILSLGAQVEESIADAISAVEQRDERLAREVVERDTLIDRMEIEVEEECLKILALHQPVASDLRFVVAVLKMNNDLERMGDLAANIAKRSLLFCAQRDIDLPEEWNTMAAKSRRMVKNSLDALVNQDPAAARQVCEMDDEVDRIRKKMQRRILDQIRRQPDHVETLVCLSSMFRHLERLGDMATNVAEDVIYMAHGEIIRHGGGS